MQFLSTLSLRRATQNRVTYCHNLSISIHALLAESDISCGCCVTVSVEFLSTLSLRRATGGTKQHRNPLGSFYPRSPCGERQAAAAAACSVARISIHALLAESDAGQTESCGSAHYFYPRSPCGERPSISITVSPGATISIHALLAESDMYHNNHALSNHTFLSTLSLRRATIAKFYAVVPPQFLSTLSLRRATAAVPQPRLHSAHFYPRSPCGERPAFLRVCASNSCDFYPRSPCGERQRQQRVVDRPQAFLSTLSLRRATNRIRQPIASSAEFLSTLSLRRATYPFFRLIL